MKLKFDENETPEVNPPAPPASDDRVELPEPENTAMYEGEQYENEEMYDDEYYEEEKVGIIDKIKNLFKSKDALDELDEISRQTFADKYSRQQSKNKKKILVWSFIGIMLVSTVGTIAASAAGLFKSEPKQEQKQTKQTNDDKNSVANKAVDDAKKQQDQKTKEEEDKAKEEEKKKEEAKAKEEEKKKEEDKKTSEQVSKEVDKKVQEGLERATKSVVDEYNKKLEEANKKIEAVNNELGQVKKERDELKNAANHATQNQNQNQNEAPRNDNRVELPGA